MADHHAESDAESRARLLDGRLNEMTSSLRAPTPDVAAGAALRKRSLNGTRLTGLDLRGADLTEAALSHCDLGDVDLRGARLCGANLSMSDLTGARLDGADLSGVVAYGARFHNTSMVGVRAIGAILPGAFFGGANLGKADLSHARLGGVHFSSGSLEGVRMSRAEVGATCFGHVDLSSADLADTSHVSPSVIGLGTLEATADGVRRRSSRGVPSALVRFFRLCGVSESWMDVFLARIAREDSPTRVLISYSHDDIEFAEHLSEALHGHGLTCCRELDMFSASQTLQSAIATTVDSVDYVVVILSQSAAESGWVCAQVREASALESRTGRRVIVPVRLGALDAVSRMPSELRSLNVRFDVDFSDWKSPGAFDLKLSRLLRALEAKSADPRVAPVSQGRR
jgi:uncharacterized protein YjbI with pentapeptide repeats